MEEQSNNPERGKRPNEPSKGPESSDLEEREYRDKDGNIHHHTHEYMEQHENERS